MKNISIYIYTTQHIQIFGFGIHTRYQYLLCFPPNPIVVFNIVSWNFIIANSTCFSVVPAAPTVSENTTKYLVM